MPPPLRAPDRSTWHTVGIRREIELTVFSVVFLFLVAAVVLVLLGRTTWLSDGFWAPDGAYSGGVAIR